MTERGDSLNTPESAGIINPGPNAAIAAYFSRVAPPTPEEIVPAADIIHAGYRELEHTQDALNICADLARDVPNATTVLAGMIGTGHEAVPKRWRSDPDEMRMVLSMTGHLEIGYLRAQQEAVRRGPDFSGVPERILEVEQLLNELR